MATRLRETVRAYLAAGESQVATAQRLFIHEKTVKYRLTQAEELLGRKIGERRSELDRRADGAPRVREVACKLARLC